MNTYDLGDSVTLEVALKDRDGVLTDPDSLLLRIMKPDKTTLIDYDLGTLTKVGTGLYEVDYVPDVHGTYEYLFLASGNLLAAAERKFIVRKPRVARP